MKKKNFLNDESNAILNPNMKVYSNPFPRKMALAIEFIEKNGLPPTVKQAKTNKISKKSQLSPLQTELLSIYDFNPTEQQMQQLKDFLQQLFSEEIFKSETNQKVKMVA